MKPPGNSADGGTPPSFQNQLQLKGTGQPLHAAGGRRTLPSTWQSQLRIQEPRQPPFTVNDEPRIIREPSLPLYSAGGRTVSPSSHNQLQHQRPPQRPLRVNQESHIIKKPTSSQKQPQLRRPPQPPLRIGQESNVFREPSLPLHAADGRTPSSLWQGHQLQIQEPRQPPLRVSNESLVIREPSLTLNSAGGRTMSPSLHNQPQQQRPHQHPLRVNQESHTIKKASSSQNEPQLRRPPQPPLRIGKESNIIKESSLSLLAAGSAQQSPYRMPEVARRQQKEPVIIQEEEIKIIRCDPKDYANLVQRLTGLECSETDGDVLPAVNVASIEKTSPRNKDKRRRTEGDTMTELEGLEVGQFRGLSSLTPTTLTSITPERPVVPKTQPFVHDLFRSNNSFNGSSSGLESSIMALPLGQSALTLPTEAAHYSLSHIPNTVPLMDENNLLGSPSVLPASSMSSSSGISSPVAPTLASNKIPLMHDMSPLWLENSFLGSPSGLQPASMASSLDIPSSTSPSFAMATAYGLSQVPNTVPLTNNVRPFVSEDSFLGSSSSALPSSSMVSSSGISPVTPIVAPDTTPFMHDVSSLWLENSFLGSSSGLMPPSMVSPLDTSLSPAAPYDFSQVPNTVPVMDNVSPFMSENILLGSSSGLQSPSMVSQSEILSPVTQILASNMVTTMHNLSPLWSENSLLGCPSSIVSPPGLSSPALPTLAPVLPDLIPETEPFMQDLGPLWSDEDEEFMQDLRRLWSEEDDFFGSPSRLQPSSIASPPGISSSASPSLATVLPDTVPETEPFMQDTDPLWSEGDGFLVSPSRLQPSSIVSPWGISAPTLPTLAPVFPESVPETEPLTQDLMSPLWSESFLGSPSSLQPSSIISPPGISSPPSPTLTPIVPQTVPGTETFMQDLSLLWSKNNFTGWPSANTASPSSPPAYPEVLDPWN